MGKTRRIRCTLALTAAAFVMASSGCNQGPVNCDRFEQRTIEANLTVIDSASAIYQARLAAGDIDAGAQQALAFLLTQPGVDSGVITSDSTVWAFFSSGLLAGTGDIRRGTTGSGAAGSGIEPTIRVCRGGEVEDFTHYVLPFNTELPGTQKAADGIKDILKRKLGWENDETFKGGEVDLGRVLGLINPGSGLLFWSGHGALGPPDPYYEVPGLLLGKTYSKQAMAEAAVKELLGYLDPPSGFARQAAVLQFVDTKKYCILLLPDFFSTNADFNSAESLPINQTKTIVYLSCCYSGWHPNGLSSRLMDALYYKGADLVCGWNWEVSDGFSCDKDTTFLKALADTCLPWEALRSLGNWTDPTPGRDGKHATWIGYGDSLVMLRPVFQAAKHGEALRPSFVGAGRGSSNSGAYAYMHPADGWDDIGFLSVTFPGNQSGMFDCRSLENCSIVWMDMQSERTYYAMKDFIGVEGTIDVKYCTDEVMTGHFSGTLGWWDAGLIPTNDPPTEVITFQNGLFKCTGKLAATSFSPEQVAPGSPLPGH